MTEPIASGYLPAGITRTLNEDGTWSFTEQQSIHEKPTTLDRPYDSNEIFTDTRLFPDDETVVQIVTFSRQGGRPTWHKQLRDPEEIAKALRQEIPEDSWRWVHCERLHGPTLRAVAEGTGWNPRKFAGIFTWTRPSMEYIRGLLLLHLVSQGSQIYTWQGIGSRPLDTFITCVRAANQSPSDFRSRLFDFVDHGCSRPEVRLHQDPSLLYYGIVRAVIQDLRFVAHEVHAKMEKVYRHVVSHPSPLNLSEFHRDQNMLIGLSLDTAALSLAAANLCAAADSMHPPSPVQNGLSQPLISKEARDRLVDQMGLINLLHKELPYISSRADALVHWAFDMLAFQNNNLLQLLAVATLASIPISVATGILGINYFDSNRINGSQIGLVLGIVGGLVTIVLFWFIYSFWDQHKDWKKGAVRAGKVHQQTQAELRDWAKAEDRERNMELARENSDVAKLPHNPTGSMAFISDLLYRANVKGPTPIRITP